MKGIILKIVFVYIFILMLYLQTSCMKRLLPGCSDKGNHLIIVT